MDRRDAEELERLWWHSWETLYPRSESVTYVIAHFRRMVEGDLIAGRLGRDDGHVQRQIRGHRDSLPDRVLDIRYEQHDTRGRQDGDVRFVVDAFIRSPWARQYGLRFLLDRDGMPSGQNRPPPGRLRGHRAESVIYDEMISAEMARLAGVSVDSPVAAIAPGEVARRTDKLQREVGKDDEADALAYARQQGAGPRAVRLCRKCQCEIDSAFTYTIAGVAGYCERCFVEQLPPCPVCLRKIAGGEKRVHVSRKAGYGGQYTDAQIHLECSQRDSVARDATARLFEIITHVANAVAARWCAALSLRGSHVPAVHPYSRWRQAICVAHGVGLVYEHAEATTTGGRLTHHCDACWREAEQRRLRNELASSAVGFIRSAMLLAAHLLWEHQVDDTSKRFMMLASYDEPDLTRVRAPNEAVVVDARDPSILGLLLEME